MKCKHELCSNEATFGRQCQSCRNYIQRYNLTTPQVIALLRSQDNTCALCFKEITIGRYDGVVDHCHITNKVRGILCHECNATVGYIENSGLDLQHLSKYLYPSVA